jgi:hypothetical protein
MPKLKNPPQLKVSTFNTCSEADYKLYKEYCISSNKEPVSYTKYKKIVLVSNEILSDKILNGARVKLPYGLSDVFINKYKQDIKNKDGKINLPIDWKKTKEYGKKIYHLNKHTDGYTFKWFWAKGDAKFKFKDLWAFKAVRKNTRKINTLVKEGFNGYNEWYNSKIKTGVSKRKININTPINEWDAKTKTIIKTWNNREELINHYDITLNYFNKLIALPQKRWLKGKTYLTYADVSKV